MKRKITLIRLVHDDRPRIGLRHDLDPAMNAMIRKIPGIVYSGTHRVWHLEVRDDIVGFLNFRFNNRFEIDDSQLASQATGSGPEPRSEQLAPQRSEPPAAGKESHPKREAEPAQINPPLKQVYPGRSEAPAKAVKPDSQMPDSFLPGEAAIQKNVTLPQCRVELANVPGSGKIMVKFHGYYDKAWIAEMRQYGFVEYLNQRKEFRLPYSRIAMDSLSDYFSACGLQVDVRRNKMPAVVKSRRDEVAGEVRMRQLGEKALEGVRLLEAHVREKRQSESTVKTYSSMLQLFFRYFSDREPKQIKEADISTFMADFVLPLGYSASFQNQMVTAVKTYYSLTDTRFRGEKLMRPRRSRVLPKVFSKEEIRRILNATVNIKHRLILWMIYSCGLRRGEILNIRLTDLDRDRNVLHIRQGKGNVDRVVPVSGKVWDKIDEYMEGYSPASWLFEGTGGGKYSAGSVYNVFKKALLRAGIKKEVGVHALRHSYATHLHESGLDIRFIQELLGHRSSRTTEIYTHVSRRNLMSIKSPIDDIDLK